MKTITYIISIISLIRLGFDRQITDPKTVDLRRIRVEQIYTSELGVREKTGNNDGARVEEYLGSVGLKKGNPWCAAFMCWVFNEAGVANPRTGWSPGLFARSRVIWERDRRVADRRVAVAGKGNSVAGEGVAAAGRKKVARREAAGSLSNLPQKGDVFGIWFPDKERIAHVGFVDSWSDKWLKTVEGNTNEAGSREGEGVWRKRRLVASVYQVSQFID